MSARAMSTQLKCGAARTVITPPIGTKLMGYAPARPAESVGDDLMFTAIALEYGDTKSLMMTADVAIFDNDKCRSIRRQIADATGFPYENMVLCSTHTHSGPCTAAVHGWSDCDYEYYDTIMESQALAAAKQAVQSMKPVKVGFATTQSDVASNRRGLTREGKVGLGQNPWGCYDPTMTVISFKAEDGVVANMIHYSAHATASGASPEITRDWPGPMVDRLAEVSGGITGFFNGPIGDTGPRLPNGGTTANFQMAMELGRRAAIDAVRAWSSIKDWRDVDLDLIHGELKLPNAPLPSLETAREEIKKYENPDQLVGMPYAEYYRWNAIIKEYEVGGSQPNFLYDQVLVRIGPAVFVPFAHEQFTEMTLRIRKDSPYQYTLCLSNANGAYAYFPTKAQYACGGYEIDAMKLCNVYTLAQDADDAAVDQNLTLLEQLKGQES